MVLWIVDDDKTHLAVLKNAFLESNADLSIKTFSSLKNFHKHVLLAQNFTISPPNLVIADYDFKREGNWISYLRKFFQDSTFPYRYMIFSQSIDPDEVLEIRAHDPNSLYVKMKNLDENFQRFLSIDNIYADIMGDLISSSTNPAMVKEKYSIPLDFAKGKTNELLDLVIKKPGIHKSEICELIDVSVDSFNKIKSRINAKICDFKLQISTPEGRGYHLVEIDRMEMD